MKKMLLVTQDEELSEKTSELFSESLNFIKQIASDSNIQYSQLACFKYKDGLLQNLITTYLDNTSYRSASVIFDSPNNINTFNQIFPRDPKNSYHRNIFTTTNTVSVSDIRNAPTQTEYFPRINSNYFFNNPAELLCNNFDYVILHHGGSDLVYYFSMLNRSLITQTEDPISLKKLILVNKNHTFDNLLKQYITFSELGIENNNLPNSICVSPSLNDCLSILEHETIYTPQASSNSTYIME